MKINELNQFLNSQFPLASAMGVEILHADLASTLVRAPLNLNHNHIGSGFGGSLNAALVFACYAWFYNWLEISGLKGEVILQKSQIEYTKPVREELRATCFAPDPPELNAAFEAFKSKGKARLKLRGEIHISTGVAVAFEGLFVALGSSQLPK
jgi:thioesterase domain-containing protein